MINHTLNNNMISLRTDVQLQVIPTVLDSTTVVMDTEVHLSNKNMDPHPSSKITELHPSSRNMEVDRRQSSRVSRRL
jgi:hypothetical protein